MIRTLLHFFKPHLRLFALDMFCAVMVASVDLAFPMVSRHAMYRLLPDRMFRTFFLLMAAVAVSYVVRSVCYYFMTYLGHTFGIRVEADIREALFSHMQELEFEFYDENRTGQLMSRLTGDLFEITELAHHGPEDLVISVLTITGALFFMFRIEWRLALVVTVLIPIAILIVMRMRSDMESTSVGVKQKMALINADIESCISGIRTSKAYTNEAADLGRFRAANDEYKKARRRYYQAMGRFMSSQEFFMGIMQVVVITFGGALIMQERMNYIDLITFSLFVGTFISPIRKMAAFAEVFANGAAGINRFREIMAVKPAIEEHADAGKLMVTEGAIAFDHVSFSYRTGREVLTDVDLKIRGGETLAVVGHSGGGKTTMCQLIPRFYEVTGGAIRIDGQDIRDVTKSSLRRSIGVVQQDVFIFADTILENIRYGRPEASEADVVEAAKKAEIYEDIMAMPQQFQTFVGERGVRLSGGQRQRISIARIFLKNPRILILDEATSALDTITEEKIQRSFDQLSKGRTTIVIAHRLATVRNADRIILLEGGTIAEEGTHEALLRADGGYARLYHTQELFGARA